MRDFSAIPSVCMCLLLCLQSSQDDPRSGWIVRSTRIFCLFLVGWHLSYVTYLQAIDMNIIPLEGRTNQYIVTVFWLIMFEWMESRMTPTPIHRALEISAYGTTTGYIFFLKPQLEEYTVWQDTVPVAHIFIKLLYVGFHLICHLSMYCP